jgi:hypothetical protein
MAVKSFFPLVALATMATFPGCGKATRPTPPPVPDPTQTYERETVEYQKISEDRDEQERVIDQLENLDRALPSDMQERAYIEIAKLEEFRGRLCQEVERHALRVSEAKKATDRGQAKK